MLTGSRLQAVIELLAAVETAARPADATASSYFRSRRYIGSKDRREILERTFAILRARARLDWHLARDGLDAPHSRARLLAFLALTERKTPEDMDELFTGALYHPKHLSAEERKRLVRLARTGLMAQSMPDWVRFEYPEWLDLALRGLFGDRLSAQMAALREEAPLDLRVNALKATRDEAIQALAAEGIPAEPTKWSPWGLRLKKRVNLASSPAFRAGLIEVQDEGSQLVAALTAAKPGEAVADYCAGAGGKTLALAAMMGNKGRLIACDVSAPRVDRAKERLRRAGAHNVTRRILDEEGGKWIKRSVNSFDRVLVDAPCSGTGTWRRNPDAKWHLTPDDLRELADRQDKILASAARLVKPGGLLVYATCSLLEEENEHRIQAFLEKHPNFVVVPLAEAWAASLPNEPPKSTAPNQSESGPFLRLTPLDHQTDGFFAAVLRRSNVTGMDSPAPSTT